MGGSQRRAYQISRKNSKLLLELQDMRRSVHPIASTTRNEDCQAGEANGTARLEAQIVLIGEGTLWHVSPN